MFKFKVVSNFFAKNIAGKVTVALIGLGASCWLTGLLAGSRVAAEEKFYPVHSGTFTFPRALLDNPTNIQAPYVYSDQYLMSGSPAEENAGLAHISAALVLGAFPRYYDDGQIDFSAGAQTAMVRQMLTDMGFGEIENNDDYDRVPVADSFGVLGAHKVVDGCDVVALVPRSVNYAAEWANNLYVGASGEHAGFAQASRERVLPFARTYLQARGLIQEDLGELANTDRCVKIWLMGLSRGAAVMNVAAKSLTDSVGADKVYYYGFGTPVVTDDVDGASSYTNLHNYIGTFDIFANMFSSWGMTRYGMVHTLDLTENYPAVNDYLEAIDARIAYQPEAYEARTMPGLDWFVSHTDEVARIWSQEVSVSEKMAQITSQAATDNPIQNPEDFTRQAFAILLEGEDSTLAGGRAGYADDTPYLSDDYPASIQRGLMDLLLILQTPALSNSVADSYNQYNSLVNECTDESGTMDMTCWREAVSDTPYETCFGSMVDLFSSSCTSGIVLTPEVQAAGIDNVYSFYKLLNQLLITVSREAGLELVATLATDLFGSYQTVLYHLPEVNLAIMAVNNPARIVPEFAPESRNITVRTGETATFRLLADFADLSGVWLDGVQLRRDQYSAREGSIVVELNPATINNLSEGEHTVGIGLLSTHQIYELPFTYTRPPQAESQPLSSAPNHARASEAAEKICAAPAPIGDVDLFQIDRQGDRAVLYFTPVSDYTDRYHVVFGYSVGDERFGGVAMHVDREQNNGVLAVNISHLDPQRDYAFRVVPVNDCAVGSWSNWLTGKAVGYGQGLHKNYRYN